MKLLNRDDFMKLPKGVVFCKGKPCFFEAMQIKGNTLYRDDGSAFDFMALELCMFETNSSDDFADTYFRAIESGLLERSINKTECRDGFFDSEDNFLVYDLADLCELRSLINEAIKIAKRNTK
jgi:hypothetical protein